MGARRRRLNKEAVAGTQAETSDDYWANPTARRLAKTPGPADRTWFHYVLGLLTFLVVCGWVFTYVVHKALQK